jgi:hypothetical protein
VYTIVNGEKKRVKWDEISFYSSLSFFENYIIIKKQTKKWYE